MKMKLIFLVVFTIVLIEGCRKEPDLMEASVTGFVRLGITDNSGVTITARSGKSSRTTYSESDGSFILDGIKTGTYNLTFQKEGYLTGTLKGLSVIGGNENYYISRFTLFPVEDMKVISAGITVEPFMPGYFDNESAGWTGTVTIETDPQYSPQLIPYLFISEKPDVAWNRYHWIFRNTGFQLEKPVFSKGQHLYARVYMANWSVNLDFTNSFNQPDPVTGAMVYYGIYPESGSEVVEFTLN